MKIEVTRTKFLALILLFSAFVPLTVQPDEPAMGYVRLQGIVFHDLNADGIRDAGEPGISGVAVSDLGGVVITDPGGTYDLSSGGPEGLTETRDLVFVSVPEGYAAVSSFWKHLRAGVKEQSVDFPLQSIERIREFTFIHASDIHLNRESLPRMKKLQKLVASHKPAFVIITGDLVKDALRVGEEEAKGYYQLYVQELEEFDVPVYSVPGNHEIFGIERHLSLVSKDHPLYGKKMYRHFLGPNYYSFTYGGVHFIGLDSVDFDDLWYFGHIDQTQFNWLKKDLAAIPGNQTVVTFNHIPFISAAEMMYGYQEAGPAPTLIKHGEKTVFRHIVSNAADVLAELRKYEFALALAGHNHLRESLSYEMEGIKTRFHQTAAVVGPVSNAGMTMLSGVTLYRVHDGKIDDGTFFPLDPAETGH